MNNMSSETATALPVTRHVAAPWRRSVRLAILALGLGGLATSAHATLQVYEGFDYTVPTRPTYVSLNGQTGGTGFATGSSWVAGCTGTAPYATPTGFAICNAATENKWNGTLTSLPQTGNYAGSAAPAGNGSSGYNGNNPDHLFAYRLLDPAVTASFTLGATTWMSFAQATNFTTNGNGLGCSLAIGKGNLGSIADGENRGQDSKGGGAVGIGLLLAHKFTAGVWGGGTAAGTLAGPSTGVAYSSQSLTPRILIAKIVWGDATTPTTISQATFLDGDILSEAAFDAQIVTTSNTNTATFDPSTYDKIAIGGTRMNIDELRVGTTFNDVIGVMPATDGPYWAPLAGGGGAGTWSSTSQVWAALPVTQGTLAQKFGVPLVFAVTAGQILIDGTVSANAGLQFTVGGYSLDPGTSTPKLSLTGADAAANTVSVSTGTTTISVDVTGSSGLTKAGTGTLVLSSTANSYGGGTMLSAGTLRIADLGSLGSGNVTFGGGTLQYPAGSGVTTLDVSGKIDAVPSGQVAKIDTNGNEVTFATPMGGDGGLTKLGTGSLTLAANISALAGAVTVSAGTLNVDSSTGPITTLNVPSGGTVNLGAGTVVTTLNVTGGTVHITGTGVQIGTLLATSGTLEAVTPFAVSTRAIVAGVALSGTAMILSGANLISPDPDNHMVVAASSGTLGLAATGIAAAIGKGAPGIPALPSTTTFSGNGVWAMSGGLVQSFANTIYGSDNHAFQYIRVPSGNFDIKVHVTGRTNALVGLAARDNLVSAYDVPAGNNSVSIWTRAAAKIINGGMTMVADINAMPTTPWLRIIKVGEVVTSYYSSNDINYTQVQQQDYSATPWGATTYIGLDMTDTSGAIGSASGSFTDVNFMGTASMPDLSYTDLDLSGGAMASVGCKVRLGKLTIDSLMQPSGAYTAANTPLSVSGNGAIIIGDNSASITLADLSQTYDGGAKAATATTTPADLAVNLTYNGSATVPVNAGSYMVVANIDDPYYAGFTMGTLVIAKAQATVTLGSLSQAYDGTAKVATATTDPSGLAVTFTYNGSATAPVEIGSYEVVGTVNDANYVGSATGTLEITAVSAYGTWASANAGGQAANLDFDNDGMPNGVEYFMGESGSSFTANPAIDGTGKITWPHSAAAAGATYKVWTSSNLSDWNDVTADATDAGGALTYVVPKTTAKLFVRLEVQVP